MLASITVVNHTIQVCEQFALLVLQGVVTKGHIVTQTLRQNMAEKTRCIENSRR